MFAVVSSSPDRVAPRAGRCLGGQFACAQVHYSMFWTIVDVRNGCLGGGCSVCFGDEKGFRIGFNASTTVHNHGISDTMTSWTLTSSYSHLWPPYGTSKYHGQRHSALVWSNFSDRPPRNTKTANGMIWMMTKRALRRRRMSRSPSTTML